MSSYRHQWMTILSKLRLSPKLPRGVSSKKPHRTLRFEQCEDRRMLATFTVNNPGDFIDSDPNVTTLREAIAIANSDDDQNIIHFALPAGEDTINLQNGDLPMSEFVTIDTQGKDITIDASGNDTTPSTADGNGSSIFDIGLTITGSADQNIILRGITLTGATGGSCHWAIHPSFDAALCT